MTIALSASVSRMMSHLHRWDIQPQHRTGTRGDLETSKQMVEAIRECGLEATIHTFPFSRRIPHNCSIVIDDHRINGVPLFDCQPTPKQGITASIKNLDEREGVGLGSYSSSGGDRASRRLFENRRGAGHVGLVAVSILPSPGIALLNADSYSNPHGLPVLQVDGKHGPRLQAAADVGSECTLTVTFNVEETEASNVIVGIRGQDQRLPPLVVITPKSSWWTCTAERGGGLAIWHECIHDLAANQPKRNVLFAATTGHELGHLGLKSIVSEQPELVRTAHAWVHLGANFVAVSSKIRMQASNDEMLKLGREHLRQAGITLAGITPPSVRPGGEARDIFDGRGRYISFLGSNHWFHHPIDRLDFNVNIESLVKMRRAVIDTVRYLSDA